MTSSIEEELGSADNYGCQLGTLTWILEWTCPLRGCCHECSSTRRLPIASLTTIKPRWRRHAGRADAACMCLLGHYTRIRFMLLLSTGAYHPNSSVAASTRASFDSASRVLLHDGMCTTEHIKIDSLVALLRAPASKVLLLFISLADPHEARELNRVTKSDSRANANTPLSLSSKAGRGCGPGKDSL